MFDKILGRSPLKLPFEEDRKSHAETNDIPVLSHNSTSVTSEILRVTGYELLALINPVARDNTTNSVVKRTKFP